MEGGANFPFTEVIIHRRHPLIHSKDEATAARRALDDAVGVVKTIVVALLGWFVWQLPVGAFLAMPPRLAVFWLVAVAGFFLWCHAASGGWSTRRLRATTRVRPVPRGAAPWLATMAPVMAAGALSMWMFLTGLGWAHDAPLPRAIERYGERPGGGVVLFLLVAGMAPLVEEFAFRGWMQRPLERRVGPAPAIAITAVVFAVAHLEPGGLPIRIAGGAALGYVAWTTRSVWASTSLHVAWNVGVLAFGAMFPRFEPGRSGAGTAAAAGVAFLACAGAFTWAAVRLRASVRAARTTHPPA